MDLLPGGYWDADGALHREFELATLTGREEELLASSRVPESASLVTEVLSRCVRRLGGITPVTPEIARQLTVADRHYLLLRIRLATFGDLVRAHLICPWPDCGERMSVDFSVTAVPVEQAAHRAPVHTMTLSTEAAGSEVQIAFRLPNGADQEELSALLAENEAAALSMLLARCIHQIGPDGRPEPGSVSKAHVDESRDPNAVLSAPGDDPNSSAMVGYRPVPAGGVWARLSPRGTSKQTLDQITALSALARSEISERMSQLAPKVEQTLETGCTGCGRAFTAAFDIHRFFLGEMRTDAALLYQEVHYLAYHYHWSEAEIMSMTRDKRRTYIDVLGGAIEVLNGAS